MAEVFVTLLFVPLYVGHIWVLSLSEPLTHWGWANWSLIQIMACRPFGANYCWNVDKSTTIFRQENWYENENLKASACLLYSTTSVRCNLIVHDTRIPWKSVRFTETLCGGSPSHCCMHTEFPVIRSFEWWHLPSVKSLTSLPVKETSKKCCDRTTEKLMQVALHD